VNSLLVRWRKTPTKPAAYKAEAKLLTAYLLAHHELPPLNYKFNWDRWNELKKELSRRIIPRLKEK
jgi:hypothetical protein